jgi:hypothetical protein
MGLGRFVSVAGGLWVVAITLLHGWLNAGWFAPPRRADTFRVGFLPVT